MEESRDWRAEDFDYELPDELIAQYPAERRSESRLLTLDRRTGATSLHAFSELPSFLRPGDCLVLNDSKVMAARLFGAKEGGAARIEALLMRDLGDGRWQAMLRPGKRVKPGTVVRLERNAQVTYTILDRAEEGTYLIAFDDADVEELLARCGQVPLPPYITRQATELDRERYQTVYARVPGSVAAPTAGLHFTPELLAEIQAAGIHLARVTLHVGPGTFRPVSTERIRDHVMHEEIFELDAEQAAIVNSARQRGGRVIAIGTTSVRVLESCVTADGSVQPQQGATRIFLYPPYTPRAVDGLLTNFHLPKSTLLMLVSTFADRDAVLAAYRRAIAARFRFFSYGDCMLIT